MISGIYKITNKINNKFYIGSAINSSYRFSRHKSELRKNKHVNKYLQRAWNKHGENNFLFEIIHECQKEELITKEQYYIDILKPHYNICKVAGSQLGNKHSDKVKKAQSKRAKGNKYCVGRKPTQDNLLKMQAAKRRKEAQKLLDRKKIDYLSLDIHEWIEKRNKENIK